MYFVNAIALLRLFVHQANHDARLPGQVVIGGLACRQDTNHGCPGAGLLIQ
jgi:hypothetical protein